MGFKYLMGEGFTDVAVGNDNMILGTKRSGATYCGQPALGGPAIPQVALISVELR
jgi:hypothetical protein